jgi:hypothetical protein
VRRREVEASFSFPPAQQTLVGRGLLIIEASRSHSDTQHSSDSPERAINPSQRPLPDNTQHTQETDIPALSGIRTRDPMMQAAADPRFIPHGQWDRREEAPFKPNLI